jgi:hypothetical protein
MSPTMTSATGGRRLRAHGLSVVVPPGWDGSIRRPAGDPNWAPTEDVGPMGTANPVVHVASFALPAVRGDYGGGAVESMRPTDVFIALVEFDPAAARMPLFATAGLRRPLGPGHFDRSTMHRPLPGHSGHQQFFHVGARAFSLYVAIGSHRLRGTLAARADTVVATLGIG